jgi:SPRY domain
MGVPGNANALLLRSATAAASGGVSRSLRFDSGSTSYLSRTPGSAGNRDLWTLAFWLKRCKLGTAQDVFSVGTSGTDILYFDSSDRLCLDRPGATVLVTTQVFRDPSAWYHIVLRIDSTNGTNANKARLYVNGSEITTFSTDNRSGLTSSSFLTNTAVLHTFGVRSSNTSVNPSDIYLADIYMVDGSSLAPSSFGETDATTGAWNPKAYTGSYGTNGFHLEFADNSAATATTLGKDTSGNGNNWTPNNLSVTAGAGNDSLVDVPTNGSEVDTGLGGQVRGNYCTWNPLYANGTLSNGNLDVSTTTTNATTATIFASSGKWYWETTVTTSNYNRIGVVNLAGAGQNLGGTANSWAILHDGQVYTNSSTASYGPSYGVNDVISIALDMALGWQVAAHPPAPTPHRHLPLARQWHQQSRQA